MKCFYFLSFVFFFKLLQGPYDVVVLPGGNLGAQNLSEVKTVLSYTPVKLAEGGDSKESISASALCSIGFAVFQIL